MFEKRYVGQVRLLVSVLPFVADEACFALKGGTAINLFVRDMPRLSVDIDLTYLPVEERQATLANVDAALRRIAERVRAAIPNSRIDIPENELVRRIDIHQASTIKVEVSPVTRGCLFPPMNVSVRPSVEEQFGSGEIAVVSFSDLYAGKICAALDRQHPRDWYDVKLLLDNEGLNRQLVQALLVYIASNNQPMNEIINPRWNDMHLGYHFVGMTRETISVEALEQTRERLLNEIARYFEPRDAEFLLSFKRMAPKWDLLGIDGASNLPALQWKLLNLRKMSSRTHATAVAKLESALDLLSRRSQKTASS
jgi:predicted nucleotidyltransferase component of viral defense system